jgi:restriction endonuclease
MSVEYGGSYTRSGTGSVPSNLSRHGELAWTPALGLTSPRCSNMLMRTTAEEHLEAAGKCLREAIKHLNYVLLDHCQGYSEYDNEYTAALNAALVSILQARQRLNR